MSEDPAVVLDKLFELADRVGDLMRSTLDGRGLTPARAEVLLVLHRRGESLRQRELSDTLRCTPRHVTALVDALEAHGWVDRRPHPVDRRAILVALTEQGLAAAERMAAERRNAAQELLGDLPADQLNGFLAVADRFLSGIDNY